ncbi:hypothetical protein ACFWPV_02610 [Streptomyces uncialis]|uniref:hypothetical protein n=1 Tax=Streptomyces uncialis TaxID=1048205 RepID=UPI00365F1075|nr:hypothetical protein OG268_16490 [Streptomyces uncialis]WTE12409.1 hypothetical protein OG924_20410 [Streptomyces uncialis]
MRLIARTGSIVCALVALTGLSLVNAPSAAASTPSGCGSVSQIGSTRVLTVGGMNAASVKQYAGCGRNYAYLYVWQQFRSTRADWDLYVYIVNHSDSGNDYGEARVDNTRRSELWGPGANTTAYCTHATGFLDNTGGSTSTVC